MKFGDRKCEHNRNRAGFIRLRARLRRDFAFPTAGRKGFTLVEVTAASVVLLIAITMALAGFGYVLKGTHQASIQDELDIDVVKAIEVVKRDLRLSSLDEMYFYPADAARHTAISFPQGTDEDHDGAWDLTAATNIDWNVTIIYHQWSGNPNQLRKTTFYPRDDTLTAIERQEQINSVAVNGNGESTHNADNARTEVVFQNLFDWEVIPQSSVYDGYAATSNRDVNVTLGSVVLSNGVHTFKFELTGLNGSSSGLKVGIDNLFVSPCYGRREAEAQLPVTAESGATAARQLMSWGSWDGNYQLNFPATATGHYFTLSLANDRWEETNFRGTGVTRENTEIEFDEILSPKDFVIRLAGPTPVAAPEGGGRTLEGWIAQDQTGCASSSGYPDTTGLDRLRGCAVRVLLKGEDMPDGRCFAHDAGRIHIKWRCGGGSGSETFRVDRAYVSECVSHTNPVPDIVGASSIQMNSAASFTIWGGSGTYEQHRTSPYLVPIETEKSYIITYEVDSAANFGYARRYPDSDPAAIHCWIASNGVAAAADDTWSDRGDVIATNCIFGIESIALYYPTNGLFTSQAIDTTLETPDYDEITWNANLPAVGVPDRPTIDFQVRTFDQSDKSDAPAWSTCAWLPHASRPHDISSETGRYIQFRVKLTPGSDYYYTPRIKDVTITWEGEEQFVDVGGSFTKGPDHGIFKLLVDGQMLKRGITIDMEIYKDTWGHDGTIRLTSGALAEVRPLNTGK